MEAAGWVVALVILVGLALPTIRENAALRAQRNRLRRRLDYLTAAVQGLGSPEMLHRMLQVFEDRGGLDADGGERNGGGPGHGVD